MPSPSATPTPITPPRCPLIDARTGLIAREWYMFFLSMFQTATTVEDGILGPNSESLLASYDAALQTLAQQTESAPTNDAVIGQLADLKAQVESLQSETAPNTSDLQSQIAILQSQISDLQRTPPQREVKQLCYGQFYDTTTQTAALANTAYPITINSVDMAYGIYAAVPSAAMYVYESGIYWFVFSIQLDKSSGGTGNFWIWFRVNGVDIPNTASQVQVQGNNAEIFTSTGVFLRLASGDNVELMFAVDDVSIQLKYFPAAAFRPAIPSIIVTATNCIQGLQP